MLLFCYNEKTDLRGDLPSYSVVPFTTQKKSFHMNDELIYLLFHVYEIITRLFKRQNVYLTDRQPCVELMAFGMLGMDVRIDLDK